MCNECDNRLEEWKSLREEIARKQASCERIALSAVGANLAVYSLALQNIESATVIAVLMLPPFLASVGHYWILTHFHSVRRIAKYIRDVLEPKTGIGWENELKTVRLGKGQSMQITPYTFVSWSFYGVSLLASLWSIRVNAGLRIDGSATTLAVIVVIVLGVMGGVTCLLLRYKESQIKSLS